VAALPPNLAVKFYYSIVDMSYSNVNAIVMSQNELVDKIDDLNALHNGLKDSGDFELRNQVLEYLIPMSQDYLTTNLNSNLRRIRENKIKEYITEKEEINLLQFLLLKDDLEEGNLSKRTELLEKLQMLAPSLSKENQREADLILRHYLPRRSSDPKNRSRTLSAFPEDPQSSNSDEQARLNALNAAVSPYNTWGNVVYHKSIGGSRRRRKTKRTRRTRR
jgi:hypothetical protein